MCVVCCFVGWLQQQLTSSLPTCLDLHCFVLNVALILLCPALTDVAIRPSIPRCFLASSVLPFSALLTHPSAGVPPCPAALPRASGPCTAQCMPSLLASALCPSFPRPSLCCHDLPAVCRIISAMHCCPTNIVSARPVTQAHVKLSPTLWRCGIGGSGQAGQVGLAWQLLASRRWCWKPPRLAQNLVISGAACSSNTNR